MNIYDALIQIAAALKKFDVRYMIVGGLAVGYDQAFRTVVTSTAEDAPSSELLFSIPPNQDLASIGRPLQDLVVTIDRCQILQVVS